MCHRAAATGCLSPRAGNGVDMACTSSKANRCSTTTLLILAQYRWEGPDALTPGKHTIVFDYTYDGPGIAKGGTGVLKVDGNVVATQKQPNSIAFLQVADETFDVGVDTRSGVNDNDYQVPFAFDGRIDKLTVNLGPSQLTADDQNKAAGAAAKAKD